MGAPIRFFSFGDSDGDDDGCGGGGDGYDGGDGGCYDVWLAGRRFLCLRM